MREYQPTEQGWRNSYQQEVRDQRDELRTLRRSGSSRELDIPGEVRRVKAYNLSDSDIDNIAYRQAETVMNRSVWECLYSQRITKQRLGVAQ